LIGAAGPTARPVPRWLPLGLLGLVAVGFLGLGLVQAWLDHPTFDEPVYVSAGVVGVLHHDLAYNEEHPPLPKVLAALPVLAAHPVVPIDRGWDSNDEHAYSARFVEAQAAAGKLHLETFLSRLVPLLEAVAVALVLYRLASDLFGRWAGVLAGVLWLADPLTLGLGHLDGVDVPFTLAVVLFAWALLAWWRTRSRRAAVVLGLAAAGTVATQVTGLLLVAVAVVVVVAAGWPTRRWRSLRPAAAVVVVAWAATWVIYGLLDPSLLGRLWEVLPPPLLGGIRYLHLTDTVPGPGYLFGISYTGGRWWYWPGSVAVKVATPVLLVLVVGPWALVRVDRAVRRQLLVAVVVPAVVLLAFTLVSPRDIGVRYLLPVIALWLVVASPLASVAVGTLGRAVGAVLALAVAVAVVMTSFSAPHSLAWTAPPFRPAFQVATNSNVDWGQDFGLLDQWSVGRDPYVAYFGPRGVGRAQLPPSRPLVGTAPSRIDGWVAASASALTDQDRGPLAWLRAYCPVGTLGGTILLYHFASPPTDVPGGATPAAVCPGPNSHRAAVSR
jgi:4-amino-4-deoxy-L-arabinose transferase-like glycosyltransferase